MIGSAGVADAGGRCVVVDGVTIVEVGGGDNQPECTVVDDDGTAIANGTGTAKEARGDGTAIANGNGDAFAGRDGTATANGNGNAFAVQGTATANGNGNAKARNNPGTTATANGNGNADARGNGTATANGNCNVMAGGR